MEIDELKNTWQQLEDRLRKQEIVKEKIVREILSTKFNRAVSYLRNFEVLGSLIILVILPLTIYLASVLTMSIFQCILMYLTIVGVCLGGISQIWKIHLLGNVNLSESVSTTLKAMCRYNSTIQIEKKLGYIFLFTSFLFLLISSIQRYPFFEAWRWLIIILAIPLAIILFYWQYKIVYKSNIDSIFDSLAELNELEEEDRS